MRSLIAATLLAACAPSQAPTTGALPAPTPEAIAIRLTQAQNGSSVAVAVNQPFAVELVGVPTAGYVWMATQVPAFLTRSGETSGPTSAAQNQPGFAGGNHWEVLAFTATAPGEGELVIEQRRPWETRGAESTEPAADTFRVTIVAR